jgi:two-component system sensor histidine kinase ChvG
LRDVARVEGQIEADEITPVELAGLLREFADATKPAAALRGIRVELVVPASPVIVMASRERLGQVFDNVLSNAVSFSPSAGVVVVTLTADERHARITVDDEGPGIPAGHLDRVFDRFFSYRPDDRARAHVGLGLAIARQIVESYGGSITASNREPAGARFAIELPKQA